MKSAHRRVSGRNQAKRADNPSQRAPNRNTIDIFASDLPPSKIAKVDMDHLWGWELKYVFYLLFVTATRRFKRS